MLPIDLPPSALPAISLWQPWASLIFTGDKVHETRGYPAPEKHLGVRIAIHAAKRPISGLTLGLELLCCREFGAGGTFELPRGAIIGTAVLEQSFSTEEIEPAHIDRICGDWTAGRFAWLLRDPIKLPQPVPFTGKQGWFRVPSEVINVR